MNISGNLIHIEEKIRSNIDEHQRCYQKLDLFTADDMPVDGKWQMVKALVKHPDHAQLIPS